MANLIFTVTITEPEEVVTEFALNRGWVAKVQDGVDKDGKPVMVDNPQSASDACVSYFKDFLVEQMVVDRVTLMEDQVRQQRIDARQAIKEEAKLAIEIKVEQK